MNPLVFDAIRVLVPVLGQFTTELLHSQIARLAHALDEGTLDDEFLFGAVTIVRNIGLASPQASDEEKHRASAAAIQHAAQQFGHTLPDALINLIIELAVQRLKALRGTR
jgi:ABC-type multidrug transport system fused ATPase/permease subunit